MSGPRVEFVPLGDWGGAALLAEYDPEDDAIRIDPRVVVRVRAVAGEAEAVRFIAGALAHERFHRAHPGGSEAAARAAAAAAAGGDCGRFEAIVRPARQETPERREP